MKAKKSASEMIKQGLILSLLVGGFVALLLFLSTRYNISIAIGVSVLFLFGMGL